MRSIITGRDGGLVTVRGIGWRSPFRISEYDIGKDTVSIEGAANAAKSRNWQGIDRLSAAATATYGENSAEMKQS